MVKKLKCIQISKNELDTSSTYTPASLTKDKLLFEHINNLTKFDINIEKCDLPTFYWLQKLHKSYYKSRFISNLSRCSTTILSKTYYIRIHSC